jgi:glycosyltransferase involved in cell wall biosynthesis
VRDMGIDVHVVCCDGESATYEADTMEDFRALGRLVDLSRANVTEVFDIVDRLIRAQGIEVVVQIGAWSLYPHLPRWKESNPQIRVADVLYNEFGHTLNHFLYEPCFDSVIVESEYMRRYVTRASSKKQPTIEVVRSGVDLGAFRPLEHHGAVGTPLTIGYIGRMSPEKNPMGFIDLAERLLSLDPDLRFRMAGTGPERKAVERRLDDSPHRRQMVYAGFVESLQRELQQLDVLVVPSKFDGRPVIVMEANACGVPVVAAPVGGIPELVEEGVNGYLLPPEEIDQIHALLSTWKRSPETLARLQHSAREYACRVFDRERMIDDYARAFRAIAAIPEPAHMIRDSVTQT